MPLAVFNKVYFTFRDSRKSFKIISERSFLIENYCLVPILFIFKGTFSNNFFSNVAAKFIF